MGLKTLVFFGIFSILVINVSMAIFNPIFPGYDNMMSPYMRYPYPLAFLGSPKSAPDFLAKAQEIAAAKVNKGFEMKKEGIRIAQQSMMNKFAMLGGDESKKAATTLPPTTADVSSTTAQFNGIPKLMYSPISEESDEPSDDYGDVV